MDIVLGKVGAEIAEKAVGNKATQPSGASFQEVMGNLDNGVDVNELSSSLGVDNSDLSSGMGKFQAISAENVSVDPTKMNVGTTGTHTDKVTDMLSEVNNGQMKMDNLLNDVLYSGRKFSNQELLVVQAQIHHFAEMTELTVKVAEQAVNNVRQIQSTQV